MLPIEHTVTSPELALYQPDIPGNTGTMIRLGACLNTRVHIIEPAGFRLDDRALRRSGMDYVELATMQRHMNWEAFLRWRTEAGRRLVLLSTKAKADYLDFEFKPDDVLLLGRESSGVPAEVRDACDNAVRISMQANSRSLNVSLAAAMVMGEALRQTRTR